MHGHTHEHVRTHCVLYTHTLTSTTYTRRHTGAHKRIHSQTSAHTHSDTQTLTYTLRTCTSTPMHTHESTGAHARRHARALANTSVRTNPCTHVPNQPWPASVSQLPMRTHSQLLSLKLASMQSRLSPHPLPLTLRRAPYWVTEIAVIFLNKPLLLLFRHAPRVVCSCCGARHLSQPACTACPSVNAV